MKTVICCVNSKYIHSSLAPWYLLAGVRAYADETGDACVREFTINQPPEQVADFLVQENATVYAFCTYIWNVRFLKKVIPLLKETLPDAIIVLGGPEVSFRPIQSLAEYDWADYIVSGEGEESFPRLLRRIVTGSNDSIAGVTCRGENGIISIPCEPLSDVPPNPYVKEYFETLRGRIAYIEGSRGCPFSCAFCLSGREDCLRLFPLERIKQDVLRLCATDTKTIKFVDRTFNCHKGRCKEIITFILSEYGNRIPKDVCFHFEIAADLFDDDLLQLLSTAPKGLFQLEAGLQSFQAKTLQAVTRKTDLNRLCQNIQTILSFQNIHLHIDLIAGLPFETIELFRDSFNQAFGLKPHMLQLGFLKLLFGSRLRCEIQENGFVFEEDAPYEVLQTSWLSKEDMKRLHRIEDALERLYNSGRFRFTLQYLLQATDLSPFDLFDGFSSWLEQTELSVEKCSLDMYTEYVLHYYGNLSGVDQDILWDTMACDALSSRRIHRLPPCLFVKDDRVSKIIRILKQQNGGNVKRGVVVLRAQKDRIAVVEYTQCDPVTGRFPIQVMSLSQFDI